MSHELDDHELSRRLGAVRPMVPPGFADAVLGRVAAAAPARRPPRRALIAGGLVLAAAAVVLLFWSGEPLRPAPGERAVRLTAAGGGTVELVGDAVADTHDEEIHLLRGHARLEGRAAVTTPRARVVGTGDDTLADVQLETKEEPMLGMSVKTTTVAAAAAGTILTVMVVRGAVDVRPGGGEPAISLRAGERATLPHDDVGPAVAAAALKSPMPAGAAAGAATECAPGQEDCDCDTPAQSECTPAVEPAERVVVNTDGAPSFGPAGARVVIVEFTDFQCRFCERALSTVHELAALYPRDVRVVLKNFPLPGHKQAHLAAQAALAAGEQGKYGEMRDLLLANQDDLGRAALESYAQKLDLDLARFRRALDEKRFAAQVDRDVEEAKAAGLTGVPAFVINGRAVLGARPLEEMKKIVDEELAR